MDSRKFKKRIQRRLYHACASDCESDSDTDGLSTSSLPLTETCMEYFQDSFPGPEGLGRLDMPMAATIAKRNQVSPCSVVLSMMYAKRLRQHNKQYLQSMSSTDVFFISMMMASKYIYDEGVEEEVYNDEWAASVGHETDDVNKMEMDFLKQMDWHLFARPEDFDKALTAVERQMALREGVKRGWFTYTEMSVLLDWDPVYNLWNQVGVDCTKMVSLLSAVYVASLVSVMGSAAIAIQLSGPMASATVAAVLSLHASISTTKHVLPTPCGVHLPLCNGSSVEKLVNAEKMNVGIVSPDSESLPFSSAQRKFVTESSVKENMSRLDVEKVEMQWMKDTTRNEAGLRTEGDDTRHEEELELSASLSKQKMKHATSVFSMWLFDSLISQVLSMFDTSTTTTITPTTTITDHDDNHPRSNNLQDYNTVAGARCEMCGNVKRRKHKCHRENSARKQRTDYLPNFRSDGSRFSTSGVGDDNGEVNVTRLVDSFIDSDRVLGYNPGALEDCCTSAFCKGCEERLCFAKHSSLSGADSCKCRNDRGHTNPTPAEEKWRSIDSLSTPPSQVNKVEMSADPALPFPLMTEVPILDPVGFFTKNSSPSSYILST